MSIVGGSYVLRLTPSTHLNLDSVILTDLYTEPSWHIPLPSSKKTRTMTSDSVPSPYPLLDDMKVHCHYCVLVNVHSVSYNVPMVTLLVNLFHAIDSGRQDCLFKGEEC